MESRYYSIRTRFSASSEQSALILDARLVELDGQKVADEKSFDGSTGDLVD